MSHFTVLVIGPNPDDQLAPFHEFECTGHNDQYVKDIDITEKILKDYKEGKEKFIIAPDGAKLYPYDELFYREPTEEESKVIGRGSGYTKEGLMYSSRDWNDGKGYRAKIHYIPEGYEEKEFSYEELYSFKEYVEKEDYDLILSNEKPDIEGKHKYRYAIKDEKEEVIKIVRRTNPNSKWDWYQLGGRWNGFFKVKPVQLLPPRKDVTDIFFNDLGFSSAEMKQFVGMYESDREKFNRIIKKYTGKEKAILEAVEHLTKDVIIYPEHLVGDPGTFGAHKKTEGWADQLLKKHIDFDYMINQSVMEINHSYDIFEALKAIHGDLPENIFAKENFHEDPNWEKLRDEYWQNPLVKAIRANELIGFLGIPHDRFGMTREEAIEKSKLEAFSTYAVLKDGEWIEPGRMGWFGMDSSTKESKHKYLVDYNKMLQELPDDTLFSIYDCHI